MELSTLIAADSLVSRLKIEIEDQDHHLLVNLHSGNESVSWTLVLPDNWMEIAQRQQLRESLSGQPNSDLKECFVRCVLAEQFYQGLEYAALHRKDGGKPVYQLNYRYNGKPFSLEVKIENEEDLYNQLLASRLIRQGYSLVEVKGEYIQVHTPSGRCRTVTAHDCDCPQAQKNRGVLNWTKCPHQRLSQVYTSNRDPFLNLGFAVIVKA